MVRRSVTVPPDPTRSDEPNVASPTHSAHATARRPFLQPIAASCASILVACSALVDSGNLTGADPPDANGGGDGSSADAAAAEDASSDAKTTDDGAADAGHDAAQTHPYVTAVLADTPVLYFRLDETNPNGVAKDDSPTNAAAVFGGAIVLGQPPAIDAGGAAQFDANSATVTYAGNVADFPGNAPCAFEAWIKPAATLDTGYWPVLGKHNGIDGVLIAIDTRHITLRRQEAVCLGPKLVLDTYQHVVITYDGADVRFYVDGVESGPCALPKATAVPTAPFNIGPGYAGVLDEVAIYDKALSAARVAAHYAAR